jgi:ATP-dependent DNA helicase PIF1
MKIKITPEFKKSLHIMQNSWDHLFISGKAGTGKSTLLTEFTKREYKKKYAIVAPTGIAAMNVKGSTIHKFFRFPPLDMINIETYHISRKNEKVLNTIEMLIIDEISMVRVDMLDAIDRSLRKNRKNDIPFGGVQMIFIGDLLQLPPVINNKNKPLEKLLINKFKGIWFFNAPVFKEVKYKFISLEKIFRQNENEGIFKDTLNNIREGKYTAKDLHLINNNTPPFIRKLSVSEKILVFLHKIITFGNSQLMEKWNKVDESNIMKVCSNNEDVYSINKNCYKKLAEKEYVFNAKLEGELKKESKNKQWFELEEKEQFLKLKDKLPAPIILKIKKGSKIMMINNDISNRWANGSLGIIIQILDNSIIIRLDGDNKNIEVEKEVFETIKYEKDEETGKLKKMIESKYTQFPFRLSWAITIHKSQGLSFNAMILENRSKMFAEGQIYVALSRCKSIKSLYIRKCISSNEILVNQEVLKFYKNKK